MYVQYWDDCGQWEYKQRTLFSYFICPKNEPRKTILKRKDGYNIRIQENNKFKFVLIDPQPPLTDILILRRYYSTLKGNSSYKRRITFIRNIPAHLNIPSSALNYALVEYQGQNEAVFPHGNAKNTAAPYVRTHPKVVEKIQDDLKNKKRPRDIYSQ